MLPKPYLGNVIFIIFRLNNSNLFSLHRKKSMGKRELLQVYNSEINKIKGNPGSGGPRGRSDRGDRPQDTFICPPKIDKICKK